MGEPNREAIAQVRRIRELTGLRSSKPRPVVSVGDPTVLPLAVSPEVEVLRSELESVSVRYQMELAAHRDTTGELLAEKDRTIARLEQLVTSLQAQLTAKTTGV